MRSTKNYVVGIALAVLFLLVANAQAELVRITQPEDLSQIFAFTVNKANPNGQNTTWTLHGADDGLGFTFTGGNNTLFSTTGNNATGNFTLRWNDFELGNYALDGFTVSSDLSFTINGEAVTGTGEFFSLADYDRTELVFGFSGINRDTPGNVAYEFKFFGHEPPPVVPEPATLAVLGLGLAGLGIARRKMKK